MAVKMRLTRMGDKKSPFYRIVIIDSRKARDGQYIDLIGTYNPLIENGIKIDADKANKWLAQGVQPTDTVKGLLIGAGVLKKDIKKVAPAKKEPAKAAPAPKAEKPAPVEEAAPAPVVEEAAPVAEQVEEATEVVEEPAVQE